jgi:hypothetical protein
MRYGVKKRLGAVGLGLGLGLGRGAIAAPTPLQQLGLVAGKIVWPRAALSSAVGDGNFPVPTAFDASGNGNNSTAISPAGNNPIYRATGLGGQPSIETSQFGYAMPAVFPTSGSHSQFGVASFSSFGPYWGCPSGGTNNHNVRFVDGTTIRIRSDAATINDFLLRIAVATGKKLAMLLTYDAALSLYNLYLNGLWEGQWSHALGTVTSELAWFDGAGGGLTSAGQTAEGFVTNTCLSPDDIINAFVGSNRLYAWTDDYGSATGVPTIVGDGSSYMGDGTVLVYLRDHLPSPHGTPAVTNVAGGSIAIETTTANLLANVFPNFQISTNPSPSFVQTPKNLYVYWGGGQNVVNGDSSATILTKLATNYKRCRNVGFKVAVFDIIDRDFSGAPGGQAAGDAVAAAVNSGLYAASPGVYFDVVVPVSQIDSRFRSGTGARLVTAWYENIAQPVHPNAAGYSAIAVDALPYVASLWNGRWGA